MNNYSTAYENRDPTHLAARLGSIALVTICLACGAVDTASAETRVLLTVDVETRKGYSFEEDLLGELPNSPESFGVPYMLETLGDANAPATFYLNVFEVALYDPEPLRSLVREILSRNQDLQLHTHPEPTYGKLGVSYFDEAGQAEILNHSIEIFRDLAHVEPIAHRAGGYLANAATLRAALRVGLPVDASLSPAVGSPLALQGHYANDVTSIENVLVLPVTYYSDLKLPSYESTRFLDIESTSLREFRAVLGQMADSGTCMANVMMHSFSFIRSGQVERDVVERFEALIDFVDEHPALRFSSTAEFVADYQAGRIDCEPTVGLVPHTGFITTYLRAVERFDDGWKNVVLALGVPLAVFGSAAFVWLSISVVKRRGRR